MPIVGQGGTTDPPLKAQYLNGAAQPADATFVTLIIKDHLGVVQPGFPVVEPAISHTGIGTYEYAWTTAPDQDLDDYTAFWEGFVSGVQALGQEHIEVVAAGSVVVGPLSFISTSDYNAIRALLGVTTFDLTDESIELDPFAPHAEMLLKEAIPDWATATGLRYQKLQLATEYGTAALIAETYAKGGFIGLARPEGGNKDWAALALILWGYYEQYKTLALVTDPDVSTLVFLTDAIDFAAVRQLLSMPELSMLEIERLPFGGEAERRVMAAVPDWASTPIVEGGENTSSASDYTASDARMKVTDLAALESGDIVRIGASTPYLYRTVSDVGTAGSGGTGVAFTQTIPVDLPSGTPVVEVTADGTARWSLLKLAAEYATAALMAAPTNPELSALMWSYYYAIIGQLQASSVPPIEDFDIDMMILSGPSRARGEALPDQDGRRHYAEAGLPAPLSNMM